MTSKESLLKYVLNNPLPETSLVTDKLCPDCKKANLIQRPDICYYSNSATGVEFMAHVCINCGYFSNMAD